MNLTDKGIKVLILFVLGTMCLVISGILYFMGYGHSTLAAATPAVNVVRTPAVKTTVTHSPTPKLATGAPYQPAIAVADKFHCGQASDYGSDVMFGQTDMAICFIKNREYDVFTFVSKKAADAWIANGGGTGTIKWRSATAILEEVALNY